MTKKPYLASSLIAIPFLISAAAKERKNSGGMWDHYEGGNNCSIKKQGVLEMHCYHI